LKVALHKYVEWNKMACSDDGNKDGNNDDCIDNDSVDFYGKYEMGPYTNDAPPFFPTSYKHGPW